LYLYGRGTSHCWNCAAAGIGIFIAQRVRDILPTTTDSTWIGKMALLIKERIADKGALHSNL
jgi:hypothetical protein